MIRDPQMISEFRQVIERFVKERLVPIERQVADDDRIPDDVIDAIRELGMFGLSIPEDYGGLGFTLEEEVNVLFEFCKTSPVFRSCFGTNVGIGSQGILFAGSEEQKRKCLPRLASGELVGSFALTEAGSGSDASSLATTARLDGDSYVLNGTKRFITNAPRAGLFTVMARTGTAESGSRGISAFLVEAGTPGLSIGMPEKKMGQQGAHVADVIFEDCRVPSAALLGEPNKGFSIAMKVLDRGRIHIAAVCVGVASRLIDESVRYARERRQFGQPIGDFQLVQALIADSVTECFAARSMIASTAASYDAGERPTLEAAACKLFASEMVGRVADRAVQIFGGAGYIADYGIERFYRDVRLFRLYEGTSQIQQLLIARETYRRAEHGLPLN